MSEFKVQLNSLSSAMDLNYEIENELWRASQTLETIKKNLTMQIRQRERIDARIKNAVNSLQRQNKAMGRAVSTGRSIEKLYRDNENRVQNFEAGKVKLSDVSWDNSSVLSDVADWNADLLKKVVGAGFWPAGCAFKLADSDCKWATALECGITAVGKVVKLKEKGAEVSWSNVLFGAASTGTATKSFGQLLSDKFELSKSNILGWVSSAIGSAVSNWNEFGEASSRFFEETAAETGIKVLEGALAGAAVGAALGATAPAWGVAALAAGVTFLVDWGLNTIVTAATDGAQTSWIECASDGLCDLGENIVKGVKEGAKNIANSVGNAVSSLGESVAGWFAW